MGKTKVGDYIVRKAEYRSGWPFGDSPVAVTELLNSSMVMVHGDDRAWDLYYFAPAIGPSVEDKVGPGLGQHAPGAKLDNGKIRPGLVLGGFARALKGVSEVGTFGAAKYTDNGWTEVPNGEARYEDAQLRHWLDSKTGITHDAESQLLHLKHEAWNALARLDLFLRNEEKKNAAS